MLYDLKTAERESAPTIHDLIHLLEHREEWPFGFEWDYTSVPHCAIGLARAKWPEYVKSMDWNVMAEMFGEDTYSILYQGMTLHPILSVFGLSPRVVARDLRKLVKRGRVVASQEHCIA